mmetsp:Transcript_7606/g.18128  ORF Transcript_7606/g.18128 Transcript_7606/m.18128 type:complete len:305 (-) Transcript_7606:1926-2840(-)
MPIQARRFITQLLGSAQCCDYQIHIVSAVSWHFGDAREFQLCLAGLDVLGLKVVQMQVQSRAIELQKPLVCGAGISLVRRAQAVCSISCSLYSDLARPPLDTIALLRAGTPGQPFSKLTVHTGLAGHTFVAAGMLLRGAGNGPAAVVGISDDSARAPGDPTSAGDGARLPVLPGGPKGIHTLVFLAFLGVAWLDLLFVKRFARRATRLRSARDVPISGLLTSATLTRASTPLRPVTPNTAAVGHGTQFQTTRLEGSELVAARLDFCHRHVAARAALLCQMCESSAPFMDAAAATVAALAPCGPV